MSNYLGRAAKKAKTPPQSEPLDEKQVKNSAGGYSYPVTNWVRLDRFLILGSEGGSYYATEQKLTEQNAKAVKDCIQEDGIRVVNRVVEISEAGRAAKNDPALFVLAMCMVSPNVKTRQAAYDAIPKVARIGTHLFHLADYIQTLKDGWGRGMRRGFGNWYLQKDVPNLQNQLVKYQSRDGWSHKDVLKLSHPRVKNQTVSRGLRWATGKRDEKANPKGDSELKLISAFEEAQAHKGDNTYIAKLIQEYGLTREMVPTESLKSVDVWSALFEKMPMTAMIRNLPTMTRIGLLAPMSQTAGEVVARLGDQEALRKARVHPIQILIAMLTYQSGKGIRSQGEGWTPVSTVVDALNDAFYLSFQNVQPTGKRWYIGLDVSGSMGCGTVAGCPGLTPRVAAAALSMVTARTETNYVVRAFQDVMTTLNISPKQRLDDIVKATTGLDFGATNCALPMLDALKHEIPVDTFAVYTDGETWAGDIHPPQALQKYRQKMGIPAKLVVVGMVANEFTIADPDDGGMLDVVGFDTATPSLIADFSRG